MKGRPSGRSRAVPLQHQREDPHCSMACAGKTSIAELCRRERIAESMYYSWSKEFLEASKRRLAGETARAATTDEVSSWREAQDLRKLSPSRRSNLGAQKLIADGGDQT